MPKSAGAKERRCRTPLSARELQSLVHSGSLARGPSVLPGSAESWPTALAGPKLSFGFARPSPPSLAAAVLILVFGRVGQLHGKKFTLYVTTDAARGSDPRQRGLARRAADRFGQPVSTFGRPTATATSASSSRSTCSTTRACTFGAIPRSRFARALNIIGDQVVYVPSGTLDQPAVADGDTLRATEQPDLEG